MYLECSNISFVRILFFIQFQILFTGQQLTDNQYRQDHSHYSQRISHRTSQCRSTGFQPHLFQGLLRGSQRRCISRGATKNPHHIRQGDS